MLDNHSYVLDSERRRDGLGFSSTTFPGEQRLEVAWLKSCQWELHNPRPISRRRKRFALRNRLDISRRAGASLFHKRPPDHAVPLVRDKTARPRPRWGYPACCSRHSVL